MIPPRRAYLKLGAAGAEGPRSCTVLAGDTDPPSAIDCETIVTELWSRYSREVMARFGRTFASELLDVGGLPREIVEQHLLVDLYRVHAFPALLADRLAAVAGAAGGECILSLPPTAGDPHRIAAILARTAAPANGMAERARNLVAFCAGLAAACFGVLRMRFVRRPSRHREPISEEVSVVFGTGGAHTRNIWQEIGRAADGARQTVIVLGQRPVERDLVARLEARGGRVIHAAKLRSLPRMLRVLLRARPGFLHLHRRAAEDLGFDPGPGFHARAAAWFLRGLLHADFLRNAVIAGPAETVVVFGLIAHADSRFADLALRERGLKTVHWLHGVVEDALHYHANSSFCICRNEVDAGLRRRHGSYGNCLVYPAAKASAGTPALSGDSDALVVTNLIHPDNRFADFGAGAALEELLAMAAGYFRAKGIGIYTWRPHPRESSVPAFGRFRHLALELGFRVDNAVSLAGQLHPGTRLISTFSGSIGDLAALGAVPAIFGGLPYEAEGHWGALPALLKFHSGPELGEVFDRLEDRSWKERQLRLIHDQYHPPEGSGCFASTLRGELRISYPDLRDSASGACAPR